MPTVETVHTKEDGEQVTRRLVTVEDAAGRTFEHPFLVTDDGHDYLGDGTPPESATDALPE